MLIKIGLEVLLEYKIVSGMRLIKIYFSVAIFSTSIYHEKVQQAADMATRLENHLFINSASEVCIFKICVHEHKLCSNSKG